MKRFSRIVMMLFIFCLGFMFAACDDGGGGGGKSVPMDDRIVGWWEGTIPDEELSTDIPMVTTITSGGVMTNMMMYPDENESAGAMKDGRRFSCTSKADVDPVSKEIQPTGTISWELNGVWRSKGGQYFEGAPDNVPVSNWYSLTETESDPESMELTYTLSNDDTTLVIAGTPVGDITLTKVTEPAPNTAYAGTWELVDPVPDDYNNDDTDELVVMTVVLGANGSFSMTQTDYSDPDILVASESGTWGIYTSPDATEYFAPTVTRSRGWTDEDPSVLDITRSGFSFQRMLYVMGDMDEPDVMYIQTPGGPMRLERTNGTDIVKTTDTRLHGMWEADGFSGIAIIDDSQFATIGLNSDNVNGPGEIDEARKYGCSAVAGTGLNGSMYWDTTKEWIEKGQPVNDIPELAEQDNWYPHTHLGNDLPEIWEVPYVFNDDETVLTASIPGPGDITFVKITPEIDSKLVGTWQTPVHDGEYMVVTLGSTGSFTMSNWEDEEPEDVNVSQETGTWFVYTSPAGYRYFVLTITGVRDYDEGTGTLLPSASCYKFMRKIYTLDMFNTADTFNLRTDNSTEYVPFERQGTDPAEPAPDDAIVGYWFGPENIDDDNDTGTPDVLVDSLIIMNSDNEFTKIQWDPAGTMYPMNTGGVRGNYIAEDGDMFANVGERWSWSNLSESGGWYSETHDGYMAYAIDGDTLTLTGEQQDSAAGNTDVTLNRLAYSAPTALVGTWTGSFGVTVDATFNSDGSYIFVMDDSGTIEAETGVMGILTDNTGSEPQSYLYKTKTAYDDNADMTSPTATYEVELVPCVLTNVGTGTLVVTIGGTDVTFTRE